MLVVGEDSDDVEVGGGGEIRKGRRGHDERAGHVLYVAQKLADYVGFNPAIILLFDKEDPLTKPKLIRTWVKCTYVR
jgi:hypothetical protein